MNKLLHNPRARIAVLALVVVAAGYFLLKKQSAGASDPTAGLPVDPTGGAGGGFLDGSGAAGGGGVDGSAGGFPPLPDNKLNEATAAAIDAINKSVMDMVEGMRNIAADPGSFLVDNSGGGDAVDTGGASNPTGDATTSDATANGLILQNILGNATEGMIGGAYSPGFATLTSNDLLAQGIKIPQIGPDGYVVTKAPAPPKPSKYSAGFVQLNPIPKGHAPKRATKPKKPKRHLQTTVTRSGAIVFTHPSAFTRFSALSFLGHAPHIATPRLTSIASRASFAMPHVRVGAAPARLAGGGGVITPSPFVASAITARLTGRSPSLVPRSSPSAALGTRGLYAV